VSDVVQRPQSKDTGNTVGTSTSQSCAVYIKWNNIISGTENLSNLLTINHGGMCDKGMRVIECMLVRLMRRVFVLSGYECPLCMCVYIMLNTYTIDAK
jgi:hypothetical protein